MDGIRMTGSCHIPTHELSFRFSRSGGPGGQNVNRRETRVELLFDVAGSPSLGPRQRARAMERLRSKLDSRGVLHIVASEARTQADNRDIAIERFGNVMAEALRPPPPRRRPTKPTAAARRRRRESKTRRAEVKKSRARPAPDLD